MKLIEIVVLFGTAAYNAYAQDFMWPAALSQNSLLQYRETVREMFNFSYNNYMEKAFPADTLNVLNCASDGPTPENDYMQSSEASGYYALTLIDSLDMLAVLGDQAAFTKALSLVQNISFTAPLSVSVFEVTIRCLGALVSAHQIAVRHSDLLQVEYNGQFLTKAVEIANTLLKSFDESTYGLPYPHVFLDSGRAKKFFDRVNTASATTLLLELGTLSRITRDARYEKAARRALQVLWDIRTADHLLGIEANLYTLRWTYSKATIGAGQDSFHEYLLKSWLLLSNSPAFDYYGAFQISYSASSDHLKRVSGYGFFSRDLQSGRRSSGVMDSLTAFYAGVQMIYGDLKEALLLHQMYATLWATYRGIPELFDLDFGSASDLSYVLRPEFVEVNYLLFRATKHPFFLQIGQMIVDDLQLTARTECGFGPVQDLLSQPTSKRATQESFFISETLKYLYLLFDETNWLHSVEDSVVFTTEAHVLFPEPRIDGDEPEYNVFGDRARNRLSSFEPQRTELNGTCESVKHVLKVFGPASKSKELESPFAWSRSLVPLYAVTDINLLTKSHSSWKVFEPHFRTFRASNISLAVISEYFHSISEPQCRALVRLAKKPSGESHWLMRYAFPKVDSDGKTLEAGRLIYRDYRGIFLTSLAGLDVAVVMDCPSHVAGLLNETVKIDSQFLSGPFQNCSLRIRAVEDYILEPSQGVYLTAFGSNLYKSPALESLVCVQSAKQQRFPKIPTSLSHSSDFNVNSDNTNEVIIDDIDSIGNSNETDFFENKNESIIDLEVTNENEGIVDFEETNENEGIIDFEETNKNEDNIDFEETNNNEDNIYFKENSNESDGHEMNQFDNNNQHQSETYVKDSPGQTEPTNNEQEPANNNPRLVSIIVTISPWGERRNLHEFKTIGAAGSFGVSLEKLVSVDNESAAQPNPTFESHLTLIPYNNTSFLREPFPGIEQREHAKFPKRAPHPFSYACPDPFPAPHAQSLRKYIAEKQAGPAYNHPLRNASYDDLAQVALAGRGSCMFAEKALIAHMLNKKVLLIGTNDDFLFAMQPSSEGDSNPTEHPETVPYHHFIDSVPVFSVLVNYQALMTIGHMVDALDPAKFQAKIILSYQDDAFSANPDIGNSGLSPPPLLHNAKQTASSIRENATHRKAKIPLSVIEKQELAGYWTFEHLKSSSIYSARGVIEDFKVFVSNLVPLGNLFVYKATAANFP